jgi:hypothetical protein
LNSYANKFSITGCHGDIANGDDANQAPLPVHHWKTADFMILHHAAGFFDILIFKAENNIRCHDILASY